MIDVHVHCHDAGTHRRQLPAVPGVGSYIDYGNSLWRVEAVLFADKGVHVYVGEVSTRLRSELQRSWAAWDKTKKTKRGG